MWPGLVHCQREDKVGLAVGFLSHVEGGDQRGPLSTLRFGLTLGRKRTCRLWGGNQRRSLSLGKTGTGVVAGVAQARG